MMTCETRDLKLRVSQQRLGRKFLSCKVSWRSISYKFGYKARYTTTCPNFLLRDAFSIDQRAFKMNWVKSFDSQYRHFKSIWVLSLHLNIHFSNHQFQLPSGSENFNIGDQAVKDIDSKGCLLFSVFFSCFILMVKEITFLPKNT